ncbi:hypothetical protein IH981_03775, partial [Patescibacteria group bacterium]|nr:hypothetical protein [Patescibacteria group bacterium]
TIIDKEAGEILYQNDSYAGILCTVEQVKNFGDEMEGQHQVAGWGHPMAQFYAIDQLKKWFQENSDEFIDTLVANGVISGDIERFKKMIKKDL